MPQTMDDFLAAAHAGGHLLLATAHRPELAKSPTAVAKIRALARDYGFSDAEIDAIYDGRLLMLLHDFAELRD